MSIDIDKLERLAKAATPGPWRVEVRTLKGFGFCLVASGAPYHSGQIAHYSLSSDAVFVASANPATVLELIGEVRRLRAELAASQAREKILREAVVESKRVQDFAKLVFSGAQDRMLARMEKDLTKALDSALDLQSDDTALRQAIRATKEEMRERAAKLFDNGPYVGVLARNIAAAIRSLEVE